MNSRRFLETIILCLGLPACPHGKVHQQFILLVLTDLMLNFRNRMGCDPQVVLRAC